MNEQICRAQSADVVDAHWQSGGECFCHEPAGHVGPHRCGFVYCRRTWHDPDDLASGRRPPPDLLRGTAESWEWVKARRRAVADDFGRWHAAGIPGCRREDEEWFEEGEACDCDEGNAALGNAVAEGSQPPEVGPDGRFPSTDDKSRANPS